MTIKLLEEAVVKLDTYLEANIVAKIADLKTRYTDTTMPAIKKWYLGNVPSAVPESPSIVIHGGDWRVGNMQKPTNLHVINLINLIVFYADDKFELRFRRLCRYSLGLIELCNAGQTAAGHGYIWRLAGPIALTDTMAPHEFLQGVTIPMTLEAMETF
ncbi:MAG: hypothetical protein WC455_17070 [Dehalococcoidia bacterium]|jgi:hypothetical protein